MTEGKAGAESAVGVVISVATGIYLDYWKQLILSYLRTHSRASFSLRFIVFTDQIGEARDFCSSIPGFQVQIFYCEKEGWPSASMNRYFTYQAHKAEIVGHRLPVMHLDADMEFAKPISPEFWGELGEKGVALVAHPGFYRSFRGYLQRSPATLLRGVLRDIKLLLRYGGIGAWETSIFSEAFVARSRRFNYVCGGAWFAGPLGFSGLVEAMCQKMTKDSKEGVVPVWHDESHLNSWLAANRKRVRILSPAYCFAEGFPSLRHISPIVVAVEKGSYRSR